MGIFDRKRKQRPCVYEGQKFKSETHRDRFIYLRTLERSGEISQLTTNVRYTVIPAVKGEKIVTDKDGRTRKRKYNIQNPSYFYADFVYTMKDGTNVVEEVKADPNKLSKYYLLKKKLMLVYHQIVVHEVYDPYELEHIVNYGKKPR